MRDRVQEYFDELLYIVANGKPSEIIALNGMEMFDVFALVEQYKSNPPKLFMPWQM